MESTKGSSRPEPGGPGRSLVRTGRTALLAGVMAAALITGTAFAAVQIRDDRGGGGGGGTLADPAPSTATTTPTTLPPTTTAPPATTRPKPKPKPKPKPTPKLGPGVQSHAVLIVQRRLIELGYADLAEASGRFDAATTHAVLAFQKVHGLGRDGVIGPKTWKALRADPAVPKPRSKARGFHVETDLTKQVTYMVKDGKVAHIINASTASGATYSVDGDLRRAVTPTGDFRIERKINAWRKSKLGLLYRPAYFVGGYAYHGSYSVPGFPASHGCIRMAIATMDRMYDKLAVGTKVHIYRT